MATDGYLCDEAPSMCFGMVDINIQIHFFHRFHAGDDLDADSRYVPSAASIAKAGRMVPMKCWILLSCG